MLPQAECFIYLINKGDKHRNICAEYLVVSSRIKSQIFLSDFCLPIRFTMASKTSHLSNISSEVSSCDEDEETTETSTESKKKYTGSFQYKVSFKDSWMSQYPVKAVPNDKHKFHCLPCGKNLSCHHQGLRDVQDHCSKDMHKNNERSWKKQPHITASFFKIDTPLKKKVLNAEVMVTNFLVQHNLPIATADHLGPLFKSIFPDNKIAQSYGCAK